MTEKLWNNPEVKNLTVKLVVVFGVLTLLTLWYTNFYWANLQRELTSNNLAIIGSLINRHPELKADIVTSFTVPKSPADVDLGLAAAKQYGYDTTLPLSSDPILSKFAIASFYGTGMIGLSYCLAFILVFLLTLARILQRVNRIALASESIVEGDFTYKFVGTGEGAFAKLEHQFSQMSRRLELTLDALKQERLYLKQMVSDISHQLKTPISSLKVFNELLLEEEDQSQAREFLQRSGSQIERMEWLISNLLKLARIEAGAIEFNNAMLPVLPTIEDAVRTLSVRWQQKELQLNIEGDTGISLLHDQRWLGEALQNIIKNSIEHTPEGGRIDVRLVDTAVMSRIIITDSGAGIHKEDLPYIFQRFYRGKHNLHGSGTGIGLALAKSIIENQGGLITVKSEFGKGTEFVLTFVKGVV